MEQGIGETKPVVKNEENPVSFEFPALTQEDLKEIYNLYINLYNKFPVRSATPHEYSISSNEMLNFKDYTGLGENIGSRNIFFNSGMTFLQLLSTLAMTRNSLIKEMTKPEFDVGKFDAKILIENRIMSGMKILDLGCGPFPAFARCCRAMGADVWTVDQISSNDFGFHKELFSPEQRELEVGHHIKLDLRNPEVVQDIQSKSQGNFHLVTEANVKGEKGLLLGVQGIAMALLKKGGVFADPVIMDNDLTKLKQ